VRTKNAKPGTCITVAVTPLTLRATLPRHKPHRQLFPRRHLRSTRRTLHRQRRRQLRIERCALVEHEAVAVVVRATNFLEVFQNAAVKLVHAVKANFLHVDRGFFAADGAGAKGHDGLALRTCRRRGGRMFASDAREPSFFINRTTAEKFQDTALEGVSRRLKKTCDHFDWNGPDM
jgi:hypothetical protein